MMTKTEKKIQNRIRFGGFRSGAEMRRYQDAEGYSACSSGHGSS